MDPKTIAFEVLGNGYVLFSLLSLFLAFEAWRTDKWLIRMKCALYIALVVSGSYYLRHQGVVTGHQIGYTTAAKGFRGKPVDAQTSAGKLEDGRMFDTLAQGHSPLGGTVAIIYSHHEKQELCRHYKDDVVLPDVFETETPNDENGNVLYASYYPVPDLPIFHRNKR